VILYYISDRKQLPGDAGAQLDALVRRVGEAAAAGVDFIQLREKDLGGRELEQLACRTMRTIAAEGATRPAKLLINSRVDIAIACGAAGVHLPSLGSISAGDARSLFAKAGIEEPVIAVSCHSRAEVERAWSEGADFVVLGPVFEKAPSGDPLGLPEFGRISGALQGKIPVLALGGVVLSNAAECLQAGAAGIAGIRLFQQGEVRQTVERLSTLSRASSL
jgi:thiamine-phosphate pyrophosphorylase